MPAIVFCVCQHRDRRRKRQPKCCHIDSSPFLQFAKPNQSLRQENHLRPAGPLGAHTSQREGGQTPRTADEERSLRTGSKTTVQAPTFVFFRSGKESSRFRESRRKSEPSPRNCLQYGQSQVNLSRTERQERRKGREEKRGRHQTSGNQEQFWEQYSPASACSKATWRWRWHVCQRARFK